MKFGIAMFPTDTAIRPDHLAREVEARGFESLWFPEHSHIPVSRRTPWGGVDGADPLPEYYSRTHEQFTALMAAAMATETLRLGSGITLLAQRDPIWTAKQIATLDVLSGGRAIVGLGYGWNVEEMESHGVGYGDRRALLREKALMMKALWTQDEASFEGEHLSLEPSWAWPKPVQEPHPPLIMGAGAGPKTIAHLVEFCDGWMPLGRHSADKVEDIKAALAEAGRDPESFDFTYWGARPDVAVIRSMADKGYGRTVFAVPPAGAEEVRARLDRHAELARRYEAG